MELWSSLFGTNEYSLNNHHCRHITGASISEIDSKCTSLFGYQPTYRELVEQREDGIRLFDRFNVDLCFELGSCTDHYQHSIFTGICQLKNDTNLKVKWLPKMKLNETLVRFSLESLLVQKEVAEQTLRDYHFNSPYSIGSSLSTIVCANEAVETAYYQQAIKFCLDKDQPIKSEITLDDVTKIARNYETSKSSNTTRMIFWTDDKWIAANRLINAHGKIRKARNYHRVMPFDACDNERYWVSNQTHVHYLCCYNWHTRLSLVCFALFLFLLILLYTIKLHLNL